MNCYGIVLEDGKVKYAVSEWVEGGDLKKYLAKNEVTNDVLMKVVEGNNSLDKRCRLDCFFLEVASGMSYLHKHSIVHRQLYQVIFRISDLNCRDLASRNILVDIQKNQVRKVKITDFGLSRISSGGYYRMQDSTRQLPLVNDTFAFFFPHIVGLETSCTRSHNLRIL
jgi:serine/threonine protein kinase